MDVKMMTNPIGNIINSDQVKNVIAEMKSAWEAVKVKAAWWNVWAKTNLVPNVNFLLSCIDKLIIFVEQFENASGTDKKATVLFAAGQVYDFVVMTDLPLVAKPFAMSIRGFVINTLVSEAIDWIVDKYNSGSFVPDPTIKAQMFGVPYGGHRPHA